MKSNNYFIISSLFFLLVFTVFVRAETEGDLAKKTQNPISSLISVPIQNNFNFGVGPDDDLQYLLNIQPVIPVRISQKWNLINRFIIPLLYQPELSPGIGDEFGLSDIQYQGFISPANPGKLIWGIGPVIQIPSATDDILGTEKWSAGPAFVALTVAGPWVVGGLVNNIWSFAGEDNRDDVNQMLIQPFVNYNFSKGWYLTSSPVVTANWEADKDNTWTIPIGGGGGKVFKIGSQPPNAQIQSFYNVEHPFGAAEWQLRVQLQFLFPK